MLNKRYTEVLKQFESEEKVIERMKQVTAKLQQLEKENKELHYAAAALRNGFAVGDTIQNSEGSKLLVTRYLNGMFVGNPVSGRSTKTVSIYGGWKRVLNKTR